MMRIPSKLADHEGGATAIEYGLIAGAVALAIVTAYWTVGASLKTGISEIAAAISLEGQEEGGRGILFRTRSERD